MKSTKINLDNLSALKETLNSVIDEKIELAKLNEAISSVNTLPLGTLNCLFENVADKLYESKKGQKLIKKYVNILTENKSMSKMFMGWKYITSPKNIDDTSLYINEALKYMNGLKKDKKILNEGYDKLRKIVKECLLVSNLSKEDIENIISANSINESVDYLINNNVNIGNLHEYTNHLSKVREHVAKNVIKENIGEKQNVKQLFEDLNNVLKNDLDSWEKRVVEDIAVANLSESSKEALFEKYKNECLNTIDNILLKEENTESKAQMSSMKMQLENKSFSKDSLYEDLLRLSELKYTLEK